MMIICGASGESPQASRSIFLLVLRHLRRAVDPHLEIDTVGAQLETAYPDSNKNWRVRLATIHNAVVGDTRPALLMLAGAVGLVLLIACANLANLMLARATARERELAVRLAIGASRGRIVRQLLAESLLIAAIGAVAGAVLAQWLTGVMIGLLTTGNNRIFVALTLDWRVFAFTSALAVLTCLIFGLAPAIRATGTAPGAAMRAGSRGSTDTRERFGMRRALDLGAAYVLVLNNDVEVDPAFVGALVAEAGRRPDAIRAVADGNGFLSPEISSTVLEDYQQVADPFDQLTAREREVLQMLAEGKVAKEIATALDISVYTVDAHRGRIMKKLSLHSSTEIVRFAMRKGLVQ
jgi:DNA-binding CsgD family transcriptional regulator